MDSSETPQRDDDDTLSKPLVSVDEARERPKTIDAHAADVGGVADHVTDTSATAVEDDEFTGKEDGLPGDKSAIFQRGVTSVPPG